MSIVVTTSRAARQRLSSREQIPWNASAISCESTRHTIPNASTNSPKTTSGSRSTANARDATALSARSMQSNAWHSGSHTADDSTRSADWRSGWRMRASWDAFEASQCEVEAMMNEKDCAAWMVPRQAHPSTAAPHDRNRPWTAQRREPAFSSAISSQRVTLASTI
jgi:hypothetical protein